jgi:hypothetical protein
MHAVPWKRLTKWGAAALAAYALNVYCGDRIQYFLNTYSTAIPFKTVIGTLVIGIVLGAVFNAGGIILLAGFGAYFSNRAFGAERLPVGGRMPALYYRDALFLGLGGSAGYLGIRRVLEALSHYWPTMHRSVPSAIGQNFDAIYPSGVALGGALLSGLYLTGLVLFITAFVAAVVKARWLRLLCFLLGVALLAGGDWGNGPDFAKQLLAEAVILAVIVIGVRRMIRFNVLGCVLLIACLSLLGAAAKLLAQPDPFYRTNGYAVVLVTALLLAWPLVRWRMGGAAASAS